jgi:NADPH:quinone reductase-like Zn-dependent oxidoreductase/malonyl CoA-acyl carrier protein transacylase/NADP-dependent 3-hydroxy acid dehydrogenase YdfG/acyl carrier protein
LAGFSLREEMRAPPETSRMTRNDVAQPANFLLQVALARALQARGVVFSAYLGHSVGEVAAAHLAGALSLDDAVRLSFLRSQLQQRVAGQGGMLALGASVAQVERWLQDAPDVVLAAYNGNASLTVAGGEEGLAHVERLATEAGVFARRVPVEVAYHSPQMAPLEDAFLHELRFLSPSAPSTPLYSTLHGERVEGVHHGAAYWWQNARQPVRLQTAVQSALAGGERLFLQIGPHPVLGAALAEIFQEEGIRNAHAVPTLHRREGAVSAFRQSLAQLFVHGATIDWQRATPNGRVVSLPRYPWQRKEYRRVPSAVQRHLTGGSSWLIAEDLPDFVSQTELAGPSLAFLRDHQVQGVEIFPAAGYVEAFCQAAQAVSAPGTSFVLDDVRFERPLANDRGGPTTLAISHQPRAGGLSAHARVGEASWQTHARARLRLGVDCGDPQVERHHAPWSEVSVAALYADLAKRGLHYGPAFRPLHAVWAAPDAARARLCLPAAAHEGGQRFLVHPSLLDGALQALFAAAGARHSASAFLPIFVRRVIFHAPLGREVDVHVALRHASAQRLKADIEIRQLDGQPAITLCGIECKALAAEDSRAEERAWLHVPEAVEVELASPRPLDAVRWVVGGSVRARALNADASGDMPTTMARLSQKMDGPLHVLFDASSIHEGDPLGRSLCEDLRALVAALGNRPHTYLTVLTQGGFAALSDDEVIPAQAALRGFARVAMTEHPALSVRLVDAGRQTIGSDALPWIWGAHDEEEIALRGESILAQRLRRRASLAEARRPIAKPGRAPAFRLRASHAGRLDSLGYVRCDRRAPGPGEVEVEVSKVGLNFKDVMKALGALREEALQGTYLGTDLGMEAAGTIARVGEGVSHLAEGDAVFVYTGGAFRRFLNAQASFCVPVVQGHSLKDAAGYFVFLTAAYGMWEAARLRPKERVLIHSAAGGVGQAAMQIAAASGAEIYATAGTDEKRALLLQQGARAVFSSRRLGFADAVRELTDGEGVDVVVGALAGHFLDENLRALGPCGRLIELGKQDIAADRGLPLGAFHRGLSFHAVDLDRMANDRPAYFAPLVMKVKDAFAKGVLRPLPTSEFPASETEEAFRRLSSGKHIGKVVVDLADAPPALAPAPVVPFAPGKTTLITGGTGGFGAQIARALADAGATHLALWSRSGRMDEPTAADIEHLRQRGIAIEVRAVDVSDPAAVRAALEDLRADLPEVAAVFHGAAFVSDGPLLQMSSTDLQRTLEVKLAGAQILADNLAEHAEASLIFLSSVSGWVGNPGQAAYAAANAALDGLAHALQRDGRAACSVALGAIGEVGMLARDPATERHLRTLGLAPLPAASAARRLVHEVHGAPPVFGLIDVDWDAWAAAHPGPSWRRLAEVRAGEGAASVAGAAWKALPEGERVEALAQALALAAAPVFGVGTGELSPDTPLRELGIDSLMAVELRVQLSQEVGISLSPMALLSGPSLRELAEVEAARLGAKGAPRAEPGEAPVEVASTPKRKRSPEALRAHLLGRICVTPPYFDLHALRAEGEWLHAEARPTRLPGQAGSLSAAEAARHLAILGSCVLREAMPEEGQIYFPVKEAVLLPGGLVSSGGAETVRMQARVKEMRLADSIAVAATEAFDEEGTRLCAFDITYHVIPAASFRALFAEHARPILPGAPASPYEAHTPLPLAPVGAGGWQSCLPAVRPEDCAGHFDGFPALPVSIMARHALDAVFAAAADLSTHDGGFRIAGGRCVTERFIWAGESVRFQAKPMDGPASHWRCTVEGDAGPAAYFDVDLEPLALAP